MYLSYSQIHFIVASYSKRSNKNAGNAALKSNSLPNW